MQALRRDGESMSNLSPDLMLDLRELVSNAASCMESKAHRIAIKSEHLHKVAGEAHAIIESQARRIAELEQRNSVNDFCMNHWQARFELLQAAWRTGNNDTVLEATRLFLSAKDDAKGDIVLERAQRVADLVGKLDAAEQHVKILTEQRDQLALAAEKRRLQPETKARPDMPSAPVQKLKIYADADSDPWSYCDNDKLSHEEAYLRYYADLVEYWKQRASVPPDVTRQDLNFIYWSAYHEGHQDTVEGRYTHVVWADRLTYHDDKLDGVLRSCGVSHSAQPDEPRDAQGTFACPICMKDTPHAHPGLEDKGEPRRWIGVDFDGTLAYDAPDRSDPYSLGEPIMSMVHRVKDWIARGYEVRLLTARMCDRSYTSMKFRDLAKMEDDLRAWCKKHIGATLKCTNQKDGLMEVLWDDRAVRVIRDTGSPAETEGSCYDNIHDNPDFK